MPLVQLSMPVTVGCNYDAEQYRAAAASGISVKPQRWVFSQGSLTQREGIYRCLVYLVCKQQRG